MRKCTLATTLGYICFLSFVFDLYIVCWCGLFVQFEKGKSTLKQQISYIRPVLEELRSKKKQRVKEFTETQSQIVKICAEIAGNGQSMMSSDPQIDERDLTVKKLGELKSHLQELQNEKVITTVWILSCINSALACLFHWFLCFLLNLQIIRLQKVDSHVSMIHELSVVMSSDFLKTVSGIHSSLIDPANGQSKSISNDTLAKLTGVVNSLQQEKQKRLQKVTFWGFNQYILCIGTLHVSISRCP